MYKNMYVFFSIVLFYSPTSRLSTQVLFRSFENTVQNILARVVDALEGSIIFISCSISLGKYN